MHEEDRLLCVRVSRARNAPGTRTTGSYSSSCRRRQTCTKKCYIQGEVPCISVRSDLQYSRRAVKGVEAVQGLPGTLYTGTAVFCFKHTAESP